MWVLPWIGIFISLWTAQDNVPAYVRAGDQVEQEFRAHRNNLEQFFLTLRNWVAQEAPDLLPELLLQDAPPQAMVYGYQMLPKIVEAPPVDPAIPVSSFSYSWPVTQSYIDGEAIKLKVSRAALERAIAAAEPENSGLISRLLRDYRELVKNQSIVDQYIQYNRLWQRSVATDRARFDQLTKLYNELKSGEPHTTESIREILQTPEVPAFVAIDQDVAGRVVVRVPVYTDIEDAPFLMRTKTAIEDAWQVSEGDERSYRLEIEFRHLAPSDFKHGDHIDLRAHAARFPADGAVLTTGAEFTHAVIGRFVALGPGEMSTRTLAHEFGHVLGFRDGYIRGYRDLGSRGFEILELTSVFEDIMSAPRQGGVLPAHFKLIVGGVKTTPDGIRINRNEP